MDLKKIQKQVNQRKQEKLNENAQLGIEGKPMPIGGDKFLKQLVTSYNTNTPTEASNRIKAVNDKTREITGEAVQQPQQQVMNNQPSQQQQQYAPQQQVVNDQGYNQQQQKMANMQQYRQVNESMLNNPVQQQQYNNPNADPWSQYTGANASESQLLNEMQMKQQLMGMSPQQQQQYAPQQQQVPQQPFNEHLNDMATNLLNENFGKLYAEAMKSSIVETYTAERVNEALLENKHLIEKIVIDVIKNLPRKSKSS